MSITIDKIPNIMYNIKIVMRDKLHIINPPTSSYDNPIPLDSLKYMKDRLLGALENPEILDKLGAVALGLYDTAQMLEPMEWVEGEELGDSHPDSDWTDKNIIPLIGCDEFVISGKQMSHMPVQKAKIDEALASDKYAGVCINEIYEEVKASPPIRQGGTNLTGFCNTGFCIVDGVGPYVFSRPVISVSNSGLMAINVATLSHETDHARDYVMDPVVEIYPKDDRARLRSELQAYAVGKVFQDHLVHESGLMLRYPSLSDQVEKVRREVNGPVTAKDAFAVHEDIIQRLEQAGLSYIYR